MWWLLKVIDAATLFGLKEKHLSSPSQIVTHPRSSGPSNPMPASNLVGEGCLILY